MVGKVTAAWPLRSNPNYVCDAHTPEWHSVRDRCVTGTTAAYIMGYRPHYAGDGDTWEIAMQMRLNPKEFKLGRAAWWGQNDEQHNIRTFARLAFGNSAELELSNRCFVNGPVSATVDAAVKVDPEHYPPPPLQQQVSARTYWSKYFLKPMCAELSRGNCVGLIEAKQTRVEYKKDWGKKPPDYYWAQCQAQLCVTGYPWCVLFAKIGVDDLRAHTILRDELFIEELVERSTRFLEELDERKRNKV